MRIAVGMSGGVDSSLTAALLVEAGHEVIGVTLHLWKEGGTCCSLDAAEAARRICRHLGIPHHTLNFQDRFEREVVAPYVEAYLSGRTPNPCVRCNQRVKLRPLLRHVRTLFGCDALATGHYARIEPREGRHALLRGIDRRKDQSYFLYTLRAEELPHLLFPLGGWTKEEVRREAARRGLDRFARPESFDTCFVGGDYRAFLRRRAGGRIRPGPILDLEGRVLGEHRGLPFYTVGQRKGLGVAAGVPLYVVALDPARNALIVGPREAVQVRRLRLAEVTFTWPAPPRPPFEARVQVRYRSRPLPARIERTADGAWEVRFLEPAWAAAPGQSAVFYRDDEVLGGGVVTEVETVLDGVPDRRMPAAALSPRA